MYDLGLRLLTAIVVLRPVRWTPSGGLGRPCKVAPGSVITCGQKRSQVHRLKREEAVRDSYDNSYSIFIGGEQYFSIMIFLTRCLVSHKRFYFINVFIFYTRLLGIHYVCKLRLFSSCPEFAICSGLRLVSNLRRSISLRECDDFGLYLGSIISVSSACNWLCLLV